MATNGLVSQGFMLAIETGASSPIVWTEVKEITDFNAGSVTRSQIDMTHLQSTAKEFKPGLPDYGTFSGTANFVPEDPGQVAVRESVASEDTSSFKITYEDGSTETFSAFVTSDGKSGAVDGKMPWTFELKLTGPSVFTPAP